ncbi:MAG: 4-hydroxy-tetrahydrodipicolinate reductase [Gammaproteobacteria bacterium]|nr:4-hydroxy-tetrahydrodipicolinate reductase [Gammaproteobacteria bacterium]MBT8106158.1 4-hydroxy-tetrahydrodipicolinate reductase [Gammaproteobacteria bacterium]NNF48586.1 4-hydroxy-tetrahydrodipicolinate reductase [Woeseiaceae bacterium]NNK26172.1 4-hydroxy-tetrahydrodipicolinate reductase [Woeseiaceae bacterium]NNL63458.1 4-hydroxy-tetrahydrodipicolinate reductase [Woeseiaceae bacterium]
MIRVAVAGAGRMGQAIAAGLESEAGMELAGIWARGDDLDALVRDADVVIDFSLPDGTLQVLDAVIRHGTPLVCGVSGLGEEHLHRMVEAAATIPVVYDRNMSIGIAVLTRAVRDAAASLGPHFDVHIAEVHHVHKKDAPSGTALKLGEAIAAARGEQGTGSVEFESERRGEVPGEHEVVMRSPTETLTLAHAVTTRQVFADGAIRAARWVVDRAPGRYNIGDVLFAG